MLGEEIERGYRVCQQKSVNLDEGGTQPNDVGMADVVFCHDMEKELLEAAVETLASWTIFFFFSFWSYWDPFHHG